MIFFTIKACRLMYMLCTCLTIMYMLLTFSFPICSPSFYSTMYMFVHNSKKIIHFSLK